MTGVDKKNGTQQQQRERLGALLRISKSECPVVLPSKKRSRKSTELNLPDAEVKENMSVRIVYACKRLRRFFQQPETLTCRGCSKRTTCALFKKPAPPEPTTADCVDVVKVLYGLAQYCRGYLEEQTRSNTASTPASADKKKRPNFVPLDRAPKDITGTPESSATEQGRESGSVSDGPSPQTLLSSAIVLLDSLGKIILEQQQLEVAKFGKSSKLLPDVPIADPQTAKQLAEEISLKKEQMKLDRKEEQILKLPPWLRDSLRPVMSKHMNARQKFLLKQREKADMEAKSAAESQFEGNFVPELDVVDENGMARVSANAAGSSTLPAANFASNYSSPSNSNSVQDLNSDLSRMRIPKRFEEIQKPCKVDTIIQFNATYQRYVEGLTRKRSRVNTREQEDVMIDLDKYWESCTADVASRRDDAATIECEEDLHASPEAESEKGARDAATTATESRTNSSAAATGSDITPGQVDGNKDNQHLGSSNISMDAQCLNTPIESSTPSGTEAEPFVGKNTESKDSPSGGPLSPVDALFASLERAHQEKMTQNARRNDHPAAGRESDSSSGKEDHTVLTADNDPDSRFVEQRGGYASLDLSNPDEFRQSALVPAEALDAVSPSKRALEGVHVYRNASDDPALAKQLREILAEKRSASGSRLSDDDEEHFAATSSSVKTRNGRLNHQEITQDERLQVFSQADFGQLLSTGGSDSGNDLKFLRRVPFDEPASRSGGTVPDKTLALALRHHDVQKSGLVSLPDFDALMATAHAEQEAFSSSERERERNSTGSHVRGNVGRNTTSVIESTETASESHLAADDEDFVEDEDDVEDDESRIDAAINLADLASTSSSSTGAKKHDFKVDEEDIDLLPDSAEELDRKMEQWQQKEAKNDYSDLAEFGFGRRAGSRGSSGGQKQCTSASPLEREAKDPARTKSFPEQDDQHPFRRDWRKDGQGGEDEASFEESEDLSSDGNTSKKRTMIFPELPDVEADWVANRANTLRASGKNSAFVPKKAQHGLKQARLPDTLRRFYKPPPAHQGASQRGGGAYEARSRFAEGASSFAATNLSTDTAAAQSEKKSTAVQLQRILNKHLKERNKKQHGKIGRYRADTSFA
ncbi:unnamed protein product [Amoebophrya sp. A120]|nr:unnamed protein product [Amoebophrya sp. A120]|eukprot:GSA120T00020248001.1